VVRILRTLKARRDMSVNEARLIVSIEDPRTREQRQLGIEVRGLCEGWLGQDLTVVHRECERIDRLVFASLPSNLTT
jgi:hypothetical protein